LIRHIGLARKIAMAKDTNKQVPHINSSGVGFQPFISPDDRSVPEFTIRAILLGSFFGVLFGAATVYLALKAGLTVSASIPIAVLAISIGKRLLRTSILENNIIQTCGSAGESVAAGVVFIVPAFLFLSNGVGLEYFRYGTILMLAIFGGILGTLMMIPLRRPLIVKEHGSLPYPEGTACAQVLIAGEKGGSFANTAYMGLGFAFVYAAMQKVFHVIAETPTYVTGAVNRYLPSAKVGGEITPEYLGVGYIIGPKIGGILVAGGVLAWIALIPLLATLVPPDTIAAQLTKLGFNVADFGWNPDLHTFGDVSGAIYRAYIRQIGAGAVATAGFITLIKTLPTIIASFRDAIKSLFSREQGSRSRTEDDLSILVVIIGSLGLIGLMLVLPNIPGNSMTEKLTMGILVVVFGFIFVTVASRIVGLIGSSNSPISGMTIATIMGTSMVFIACGFTGQVYEPMVLVVGSMICISAANAGATSQDLKTGYLVGATPRYQQIALFIGVIVSSLAIGLTVWLLDTPTGEMKAANVTHAIGTPTYPAPQATLMATLVRGLLSNNLDWQYVLVGAFIALTMELCGVKSLSFAVGLYLPLTTTLPIFIGGAVRGLSDKIRQRGKEPGAQDAAEEELGKGNLFATGLVAGGALAGVIVAMLVVGMEKLDQGAIEKTKAELVSSGISEPSTEQITEKAQGKLWSEWMNGISFEKKWEHSISEQLKTESPQLTDLEREEAAKQLLTGRFNLLGVVCFAMMALALFLISLRK
jgi:putative OPT family oligopeptide transporter